MVAFLVPVIYWVPSLLTGCVVAVLALLIWRRWPSRPAAALSLYLLSVAIWSIGYCFQLRGATLAQQVFWSKVEYIGPAGVSLAGLVFVLQFSGLNDWVRARWIVLLAVIPAITQVIVWTNERHGLIWRRVWVDSSGPFPMLARTHGPWFWVFLLYDYALCLISIGLLFREFINRKGVYRSQAGVLLLGCLVPFAGNFMYSFGFSLVPHLDFTVFGFSITGLAMAWGIFRFQLPVIMPIARQAVFAGMSDAVIALDNAGNIVDMNPAAARLLGQSSLTLIGRSAPRAFYRHPDLAKLCLHPQETRAELRLETLGVSRSFEAQCTFLKTPREQIIGSLILLHDITDRQAAEAALRQAHSALEQRIDERTADLSRTIEELRVLENQLIFSASHDSLTELANRKLFLERVCQRLSAMDKGRPFAVLYIDLDRFKIYNDGYGHHLGDLILIEMGQRLKSCLRNSDTVARMGGDEFTILLDDVANATEAFRLAEQCLQGVGRSSMRGKHRHSINRQYRPRGRF